MLAVLSPGEGSSMWCSAWAQMVNFHQLFCSFSNSGIRRDRFFTIPFNLSQSCLPSLCFCFADSLSVLGFAREVNTGLGAERDLAAFTLLPLPSVSGTQTTISNLEIK